MNKNQKDFYFQLFSFFLIFWISGSLFYSLSFAEIIDITSLFSPEEDCACKIIEEIKKAEKSILIAMYTFTSESLAQSLVQAEKRGVSVKVCLDGENAANKYSKAKFLAKNGITPKLIFGQGIMHHKFCIIDDRLLLTGSFNWTASADLRNDENVIFIKSNELAEKFKFEFFKLWDGEKLDAYVYSAAGGVKKESLNSQIITVDLDKINTVYIGNKKNKKLHKFQCPWAQKMNGQNKIFFKSIDGAKKQGFMPCKSCNP
ncbi:MAG: phospholipase D-like domain-containing protein [Candidatus Omnitrophota bacterium]